jgi:hypothetical protein
VTIKEGSKRLTAVLKMLGQDRELKTGSSRNWKRQEKGSSLLALHQKHSTDKTST